jgi:microcystin-dependent protein
MSFLFFYPRMRPLADNGDPMPGAKLQFYQTGTTTPTPVYANATLTTPLSNPVIANAAGIFPAIYGDPSIVYRMRLLTAADVLVSDDDPIHPHASFPAGTIVMFNGSAIARDAAYPPALWAVCDGASSTPDSRDRVPVGVSATKPIGTPGGSASGTISTSAVGDHSHAATVAPTTLTLAQVPAHSHHVMQDSIVASDVWSNNDHSIAGESTAGGDSEYDLSPTTSGTWRGSSESMGGGGSHTHTATTTAAGTHGHTIDRADLQPPYFPIWFLQRKP